MNRKVYYALIMLAVGNISLYGVPYIKDVYYELMVTTLNLNNFQMGIIFSVYGIAAAFSYLIGGVIADMFSTKLLVIFSLLFMSVLDAAFALSRAFSGAVILFALMAVFSILTFYPALMKMQFAMGEEVGQGTASGVFNTSGNVVALGFNAIGTILIGSSLKDEHVFRIIVIIYAVGCLIGAAGVAKFVPAQKVSRREKREQSNVLKQIREVAFSKEVWLMSGVVLSYYLLSSSMAYLNPYLLKSGKLNETFVYGLSMFRTCALAFVIAPLAGVFVDKTCSLMKTIRVLFVGSFVLFGAMVIMDRRMENAFIAVALILLITAISTAQRTIIFLPIYDLKTAKIYQGTVIGIVSFIGYLPDSFYYTIMGKVLDTYTNMGYSIVFGLSAAVAVTGYLFVRLLEKVNTK